MSKPFHILIIGGGIGGLTLAQELKRAGVSAAVYERDRTLTDRLQGYRVHISPTGSLALHECLPPHLFGVFDHTCGGAQHGCALLHRADALAAFPGIKLRRLLDFFLKEPIFVTSHVTHDETAPRIATRRRL